MVTQTNLRGISYMLFSGAAFMINDSFMKLNLANLPPYQVLVLRGLTASILVTLIMAFTGELRHWRQSLNVYVLLRGALEACAILTYILALAHAAIGDVTAVFQTTPLLVILAMFVFYQERISAFRLALIALGFAGALLVAQPGFGAKSPYVLFAFVTAIFAALRDLIGRRIPKDTPTLLATLSTIVIVMISAFVCNTAVEGWQAMGSTELAYSVFAAIGMTLGHFFTLLAYKNATPQTVAPFYYSFMIFAVIAGFFIFREVPNTFSILGMAIIMASGLSITWLERRNHA